MINNFPKGNRVALCENEVEYNVSGLFLCADLVYKMIEMVNEKYDYRLPIKYMYGSPKVRWNGGRVLLKANDNSLDREIIEKEFEKAVEHKIIPLLTFSNTLLKEEDLHDDQCNCLLEIANEYEAQIIVSSEILERYIREKYPEMKIHASVIKTAFQEKRDCDYYDGLSRDYFSYVVHPDDNFDIGLLEKIEKRNAEIILNERCYYDCKIRKSHYESISREQLMLANNNYKHERFVDNCSAIPEIKQLAGNKRNVSLTVKEMCKMSEMGFKTFKIQGRTDSLYVYFFDLMRYTLENDMIFPNAYTTFLGCIDEYLKNK